MPANSGNLTLCATPPDRTPLGPLLGAAGVYLIALTLTGVVFVLTRGGQQVDGELLPRAERGGSYRQDTALLGPAKALLAFFGDVGVLAVLLTAVVLTAALSRRFWAGLAGVAVFGCAVGAAKLLKAAILRPDLGVDGSTTHNSFPSGHVAAAAGLLCAGLLAVPARARWWVAVPGAAGVTAVASATMIVGWHRLSDVVGAVLLALLVCCLAAAALAHRRGVTRPPGRAAWLKGALLLLLTPLPALVTAVPAGEGPLTAIVAASVATALAVAPVLLLLDTIDFTAGTAKTLSQ
ncbi:phosphatase PAP2 family protein [Amycolatopsis sp. H20-H5]|uniref:phosphatase PAP2 family protein n=1 Tax=Amycolatopsis sp. H20-H5 TaxID=3046309 RepID=UPI002DB7C66A|nr:phosphatase PAP2 family protein [Amycolatopsis sp. H20-H5]MEC3982263.1 phosphatase PAP2 family protein [Amycolatopsis sp. H20-H5]